MSLKVKIFSLAFFLLSNTSRNTIIWNACCRCWMPTQRYFCEAYPQKTWEMAFSCHIFPRMGVVQGVSRSRNTLLSKRLKTLESDISLAAKIGLAFYWSYSSRLHCNLSKLVNFLIYFCFLSEVVQTCLNAVQWLNITRALLRDHWISEKSQCVYYFILLFFSGSWFTFSCSNTWFKIKKI